MMRFLWHRQLVDRYAGKAIRLLLVLSVLLPALCVSAQGVGLPDTLGYKLVRLNVDHLPNLNISRVGHATLCLNGELVVFGGHTDGFVPTATAEYLRDGEWHTVPLAYPHDAGTILELRSGKVFMAGGHKEALGIGQLFSAELYDPATHTTKGFGCMDKKRAYANALEMADGEVVIAGNWYAEDGIEKFDDVYNPRLTNAVGLKDVAVARAMPYILKISADDAIIFSSLSEYAKQEGFSIVDRLKGESYHEPLLDTWHAIHTIEVRRSTHQFVGNEAEGDYQWLLPVENDELNRVAIARVKGPDEESTLPTFSLLPTVHPLPDNIHGKQLLYSSLVCDRERGVAYLIGSDDEMRIYVVAINYTCPGPAPFTVYYTEPQAFFAQSTTPALTPEGDLVFAGGRQNSNFFTSNAVVRLPLGVGDDVGDDKALADPGAESDSGSGGIGWWLWVLIGVAVCAVVALAVWRIKARTTGAETGAVSDSEDEPAIEDESLLPKDDALVELFGRIEELMQKERLYLNANLRASDVAVRIGTNTTYISAAINTQRGCSFSQYLTAYRIAYAKQLLRNNPASKISSVSALSGFSTDSTFFRAFRASTGMSPKEWISMLNKNH